MTSLTKFSLHKTNTLPRVNVLSMSDYNTVAYGNYTNSSQLITIDRVKISVHVLYLEMNIDRF
jgi:hypothetical protein